jgi:hypothetical protein
MAKRREKPKSDDLLTGWAEVAEFLELPVSTAHRFAKEGMPVSRQGRHVVASREELMRWVGSSRAGRPSAIVNNASDLAAELKRSLKGIEWEGDEWETRCIAVVSENPRPSEVRTGNPQWCGPRVNSMSLLRSLEELFTGPTINIALLRSAVDCPKVSHE